MRHSAELHSDSDLLRRLGQGKDKDRLYEVIEITRERPGKYNCADDSALSWKRKNPNRPEGIKRNLAEVQSSIIVSRPLKKRRKFVPSTAKDNDRGKFFQNKQEPEEDVSGEVEVAPRTSVVQNPAKMIPELALLYLIDKYDFPLSSLQSLLQEEGLRLSLSRVEYADVAPFVGLDPFRNLGDIGTFELYRSRIPTSLFETIVDEMDIMLMHHGPLFHHKTEHATPHFLAPVKSFDILLLSTRLNSIYQIFTRLTAQFGFTFKDVPEPVIEGRVPTSGRTEYYFTSFGAISILVVEINRKLGPSYVDVLDAIAQVIAECAVVGWNNSSQDLVLPVIGILWDGVCFQFFKFDGTTTPYSFLRGALPGDPRHHQSGLTLPNLVFAESSVPFLRSLRRITEIIFDLLLCAYISSIEAFLVRTQSHLEWQDALKFARKALGLFRDAESKRQMRDDQVDEHALLAQMILRQSLEAVPIREREGLLIKSGWSDEIKFV